MERFELAVEAVRRAGDALRASRVEDSDIQFKTGYKDLVTYWDRRIEQLLREEILAAFPDDTCLLYTSPSPRDISGSRMPSSA